MDENSADNSKFLVKHQDDDLFKLDHYSNPEDEAGFIP